MQQTQTSFICLIDGNEFQIPLCVHRRKRKTVGITVKPTLEIHIYWPERLPLRNLKQTLEEKRSWLEKHLTAMSARQLQQKQQMLNPDEGLWLLGSAVAIALPRTWTPDQRQKALEHCFDAISGWFLTARFEAIWLKAQSTPEMAFKINFSGLKLRTAGTRWGSCTSKGGIMLNRRLFGAPVWVIDYVIWHELCHLVHLNHSDDFWYLCESQYPRSKEARHWLKQHQGLLIKQI